MAIINMDSIQAHKTSDRGRGVMDNNIIILGVEFCLIKISENIKPN